MVGVSKLQSYRTWYGMIRRCYDKKYHIKKPTYIEASVCEEWRNYSAFKQWFDENYIENYVLDKDILVKGNKIYSPTTCCFVPYEINAILTKSDSIRGDLPIGVRRSKSKKYYEARLSVNKTYFHLGTYDSVEIAFAVYRAAKKAWVNKAAEEYYKGGFITERVYNALKNYEVEISD